MSDPIGVVDFERVGTYGTISASSAIEQDSLPQLSYSDDGKVEPWNDETAHDRLNNHVKRLQMSPLSKAQIERASLVASESTVREKFRSRGA